jgi:hypothetical protein
MLRAVGEPRRIERAIKRLQGALKGVPARGVRLTWRGGEMRTTIHWARDDRFWWAVEARGATKRSGARHALILGHAPDAPTKRESITCEINLPRTAADRRVAGFIAVDGKGALYLAHSGRMGGARTGQRKASFRTFHGAGVWRAVQWPDGEESASLIVAPLDSPRLTRLLGLFVDAVRRFKAGDQPVERSALFAEPDMVDSTASACDRRLVDASLHEELAKRGVFGGVADLFSLRADAPRPHFALVADGQPAELAQAVGTLSLMAARSPNSRPILIVPSLLADREGASLRGLAFPCVRFKWRGARAVFDGLDDALA